MPFKSPCYCVVHLFWILRTLPHQPSTMCELVAIAHVSCVCVLQDIRRRMSGAVGEGMLGEVDVDGGSMAPMHGAESQPMLRKNDSNMPQPPDA